jgi:hypothetical protein
MFLVAHSHNAEQLESYCVHFIAMNEAEVLKTRQFERFVEQAHEQRQLQIQEGANREEVDREYILQV